MSFSNPKMRRNQGGQAMTEFILISGLCLLVVMGATAYFLNCFGDHYLNIVKVVCLPFP